MSTLPPPPPGGPGSPPPPPTPPAGGWSPPPVPPGPPQAPPPGWGGGPPQPPGGWQPPPATPPPARRSPVLLIIVAVVAVMALVTSAVVAFVVLDDDETASGEIFLEEAGSTGQDPFGSLPGPVIPVSATAPAPQATTAPATVATRTVNGGERGLYGGSLDGGRCDPEGQIAFLAANPSLASAFVNALNRDPALRWSGGTTVSTAQLPQYIRELTSVTLANDTRVTNYGYRNGRATPRQAVLQAGTAVMVDRYGVPRIKCNCGNPLTPPQAVSTTPVYTGTRWPGFNPATIVVVNQSTVQIDVFVLVNLTGTGTIERTPGSEGTDVPVGAEPPTTTPPATTPPATAPPATAPPATAPPVTPVPLGTGDVRVTLTWTGDCDLDLHVIDPTGFEISYGDPTSPSGGQLDVDDIPDAGETGTHVENVFWPAGAAPRGTYTAFVRNLGGYSSSACDYSLQVFVNGVPAGGSSGSLGDTDSPETVFTF